MPRMSPRPHIDATTTDLETALRTTGAVRTFTDRPVTRAEVIRILDVARFAPSGGNQQPWHVVTVESPRVRAQLGTLIVDSAKEYIALAQAAWQELAPDLEDGRARSASGDEREATEGTTKA